MIEIVVSMSKTILFNLSILIKEQAHEHSHQFLDENTDFPQLSILFYFCFF